MWLRTGDKNVWLGGGNRGIWLIAGGTSMEREGEEITCGL